MLKKKIEKLIDLIENTEIEEIEVSSFWGAQKIRLSKSKSNQSTGLSNPINEQQSNLRTSAINSQPTVNEESAEIQDLTIQSKENNENPDEENYEDETKFKIITAPLVGTFYSSPKPDEPGFISIGDNVKIGKIVCIIEAMKIFNEIESEDEGELVHIYVENGTPVEYGQELFVLRINNV